MDALIRRKSSDSSLSNSLDFDIVFIVLIIIILVIGYLRAYIDSKMRNIPKLLSWCFPRSNNEKDRVHPNPLFDPNRPLSLNEPKRSIVFRS
jgi:hypothetical protein